jgi:hypothetical protein
VDSGDAEHLHKADAAADGGHHCGLCLHLDQTSAKIMP